MKIKLKTFLLPMALLPFLWDYYAFGLKFSGLGFKHKLLELLFTLVFNKLDAKTHKHKIVSLFSSILKNTSKA